MSTAESLPYILPELVLTATILVLFVGDLLTGMDGATEQIARLLEQAIEDEQRHFLEATALSAANYRDTFGTIAQSGIELLVELAKAHR